MSGFRDAREQRFEAGADEAELVGEFAVGGLEGDDPLLQAAVFRHGSGVLAAQARLFGSVAIEQLFELLFE